MAQAAHTHLFRSLGRVLGRVWKPLVLALTGILATALVAGLMLALRFVTAQVAHLRQDVAVAHQVLADLRSDEEARDRAIYDVLVDIQQPPSNDKLFTILAKGVTLSEQLTTTSTVGTTPAAAFSTDLVTTPYDQRTDAFTQEFTVQNKDDVDNLCFGGIAWASAGATCTLKCAASALTCSGAATDGTFVAPGATWSGRFDGTMCVCVVASNAGTPFQTQRIVR